MTTRFFTLTDAAGADLAGQTVAILGYGSLGRPMALNLRDSGTAVVVGNRDDDYRARAEADGFTVISLSEAAAADIVLVLIPDEEIGDAFASQIAPRLRAGAAVCFASGYALAYGHVTPPSDVDVLLFAPRMLGEEVRRTYLDGTGFFSYLSVEQGPGERGWPRLLALAAAAGSLRKGAMYLPAAQEALLDLFIEQSFGAYLGTAVQIAFEVGRASGLPPEALVLEMYQSGEMARTFGAFAERGFFRSVEAHGVVAAFGGYLRTLELDRAEIDRHFRAIRDDIATGQFTARFQAERSDGYPSVEIIRQVIAGDDPMSRAEHRVREALTDAARVAPVSPQNGPLGAPVNGNGSEIRSAPSPAAGRGPAA